MKKIKSLLIPLAFTAFLFVGCSDDDDDNSSNEVNFFDTFLALTQFNENVEEVFDDGDYEFGLYFRVAVNGDMERISLRLPEARNDVRVTVWNVDTQTVIRTELIDVQAGVKKTADINDIDLTAGTQYAITMNSDTYYYWYADDGQIPTYPITAGNIIIDSYRFVSGAEQVLPEQIATDYYAGDLGFTFEAD